MIKKATFIDNYCKTAGLRTLGVEEDKVSPTSTTKLVFLMMDLLAFVHSGYFFPEIAIGIPSLSLIIRENEFSARVLIMSKFFCRK